MLRKIFTVGQINKYIKRLLESDGLLGGLFITGEISNFKAHTSGHWYFTLKDADAAINCVMFRGSAMTVPFRPENGVKVILGGSVSLYEKTGVYQFYSETMEPSGKGALALAFEQRKEKLEAEGLFDPRHKKPIPYLPSHAAVITSPTGAAIRDIITVARRRNPHVELTVIPALVQGQEAAASIAEALHLANRWGRPDVIILARGGGSLEDLWPFNEEIVARAVFASKIPVISAIGHETDFTIADFTADLRAATPSAAAELAIPEYASLLRAIEARRQKLIDSLTGKLQDKSRQLQTLRERPVMKRPLEILERRRMRMEGLAAVLQNLSPLAVLRRGYTVVMDAQETVIPSVCGVSPGQMVKVRFWDGVIECQRKN